VDRRCWPRLLPVGLSHHQSAIPDRRCAVATVYKDLTR
jgi:hypothetical protein